MRASQAGAALGMPTCWSALVAAVTCFALLCVGDAAAPSATADSCADLGLSCRNAGTFDQTASSDVNCFAPPDSCSPVGWLHLDKDRCSCPAGFHGYECELAHEEACTASSDLPLYDRNFLNNAVDDKVVECLVPPTSSLEFWNLKDNRVKLYLHAKSRTLNFELYTRIGTFEGNHRCSETLPAIVCNFTNCEASRLLEGNQQKSVKYQCPGSGADCRGCAETIGQACITINAIVSQLNGAPTPVELTFDAIQPNASAVGLFEGTTSNGFLISLPLVNCMTGQCVANVTARNTTLSSTGPDSAAIAAVATVSAVTLAFVVAGTAAVVAGRRVAVGGGSGVATGKSSGRMGAWASAKAAAGDAEAKSQPHAFGRDPLEPCFGILFEDIAFSVKTGGSGGSSGGGGGERRVLDGVSGVVRPGELVAILGPSGAGKTSLLNILGSLHRGGRQSGRIELFAQSFQACKAERSATAAASSAASRQDQKQQQLQSLQPTFAVTSGIELAAIGPAPSSALAAAAAALPGTVTQGESGGRFHSTSAAVAATTASPVAGSAVVVPAGAAADTSLTVQSEAAGAASQPAVAAAVTAATRAARLSYVLQHEQLATTLTVRETLTFSARLRCPLALNADKQVNAVLRLLRLSHIAESFIGSPDSGGISGGERRRVTIGIELVSRPDLLLLDEPTSGLDSANAALLMQALRDVSNAGCTTLLSIHQASVAIFARFDKIVLLTPLGRVAYCGPPAASLAFLQSQQLVPLPLAIDSPALASPLPDLLLDVVTSLDAERLASLAAAFAQSEYGQQASAELAAVKQGQQASSGGSGSSGSGESKSGEKQTLRSAAGRGGGGDSRPLRGFWTQLFVLISRSLRNVSRDPTLLLTHVLVTLGVAIALGFIFWQLDNQIPGIQNRIGALFFLCIFFALTATSCLPVFVSERPMFLREFAAGFYSPSAYFCAQVLSDLVPLRIFPPFFFSVICYWMMGLQANHSKFLTFLAACVLVNCTATAIALAVSSASANIGQANLLTIVIFLWSIIFGGLLLNNDATPLAVVLSKTSFIHFGYESLFVTEFDGLRLTFNPKGSSISTDITGQVIINNYSMDLAMQFHDLWILLAFFCGFLLLSFVCLLARTKR